MTELAVPAGSLQCALYAFKGGANAVYFGLKSFSARKGAVNFSFEDARKLKALCQRGGGKFYVTLNTIVNDKEIEEVIPLLRQLEYLQPDGIIVQDLGIAKIIRDSFPDLALHGSTQLAVHTVNGVKELQRLGFLRVVLSRELSFEEIKEIRKSCPDVELKVFIHGALCYGFSGLCMASREITGRSANRGACAQICRTWFTCRETGTDSRLFSMKDLCLGELVKKYEETGIDALKIEGRMKGPDYAYWCARYYRLVLDGKTEEDEEVRWAKEAMQVSFSRETTNGFFDTGKAGSINCSSMVCITDPGHRGIQVGTIDKVFGAKAAVRFSKPVAVRDGLKVVFGSSHASFSLSFIEGGKSFISAGETAVINFPLNEFERKPVFETPVFCISRHNLNMVALSENIPLYKQPIDIKVEINRDRLEISAMGKEFNFPFAVQQAKSQTDIESVLKRLFKASDKSFFTIGNLETVNNSGFADPFLPLSALKKARRDFYEKLDSEFEKNLNKPMHAALSIKKECMKNDFLPPRKTLGLWDSPVKISGQIFMPLSPAMFNEEEYLKSLDKTVSENPGIIIGLNNIAQVRWARKNPGIKVFADYFLYTENSFSYESLKSELPNLIGAYELERDTSFNYTGDDFSPPLFISRVCMKHNSLGLPCEGCSGDSVYSLYQNGNKYRAVCKNCITVVTRDF